MPISASVNCSVQGDGRRLHQEQPLMRAHREERAHTSIHATEPSSEHTSSAKPLGCLPGAKTSTKDNTITCPTVAELCDVTQQAAQTARSACAHIHTPQTQQHVSGAHQAMSDTGNSNKSEMATMGALCSCDHTVTAPSLPPMAHTACGFPEPFMSRSKQGLKRPAPTARVWPTKLTHVAQVDRDNTGATKRRSRKPFVVSSSCPSGDQCRRWL